MSRRVWNVKIWEPSCKIGGKHEIWHTGLFLPIFHDSKGPGKLEWNGTLNLEPYRVQGAAKTAPNSKIHIFFTISFWISHNNYFLSEKLNSRQSPNLWVSGGSKGPQCRGPGAQKTAPLAEINIIWIFSSRLCTLTNFWVWSWIIDWPRAFEYKGGLGDPNHEALGAAKTVLKPKIHISSIFASKFLTLTNVWVRSWIQDKPRAFEIQGGLRDLRIGFLGSQNSRNGWNCIFLEYFFQNCV